MLLTLLEKFMHFNQIENLCLHCVMVLLCWQIWCNMSLVAPNLLLVCLSDWLTLVLMCHYKQYWSCHGQNKIKHHPISALDQRNGKILCLLSIYFSVQKHKSFTSNKDILRWKCYRIFYTMNLTLHLKMGQQIKFGIA